MTLWLCRQRLSKILANDSPYNNANTEAEFPLGDLIQALTGRPVQRIVINTSGVELFVVENSLQAKEPHVDNQLDALQNRTNMAQDRARDTFGDVATKNEGQNVNNG